MRIYLAHPISGLTREQVLSYYTGMGALLGQYGYNVLQPMTGKGELRVDQKYEPVGYDNPVATNHAIIERDNWMVHRADVVLVDLRGAKTISIGCMMELAWAHDLKKHTVVLMEKDNIHRHAFVMECADIVFELSGDCEKYLYKLITQAF